MLDIFTCLVLVTFDAALKDKVATSTFIGSGLAL